MPKKLQKQSVYQAPQRRARNFFIELYPDSSIYDCETLLADICSWFDEVSYILHDRDVWLDDCVINGVQHKAGDPKKPHYHVLVKSRNAKFGSSVCDKLGIPYRDVQYCDNYNGCMRYLLHLDNVEKFQYNMDDVFTNCPVFETVCNIVPDKGAIFMDVFKYLQSNPKIVSWEELLPWAAENGFLDVCFSRFNLINAILLSRERAAFRQNVSIL